MIKIKIAISSNINFYKKTLPILLESLLNCGIERKDIYVFIGGAQEEKKTIEDEIIYFWVNHNSMEYTPLIEICNKKIWSDYWFLIHDTCKVGTLFKEKLYNIPTNLPEKVALYNHPSMSIGLYKYKYLIENNDKIIEIKNSDDTEVGIFKYKKWCVENEDYVLYKMMPYPLKYSNFYNQSFESNWYGTNTMRIVEYYPEMDLYKSKSNWYSRVENENYEINL